MPFAIPALADCVDAVRQAFRSYLKGTDGYLWPNNIGPSAKVIGGSAWEIYNRLDYVQRAKFALTAVKDDLDMHGAEFNIPRKLSAPASGNMVVTTLAALTIAAGAQFQRLDGSVVIASAGGVASVAGSFSVPVVAATNGSAANSQAGTAFTIISGASGPGAATATAAADSSGISSGLDVEPDGAPLTADLSTYRGRILFRKRNPIQGGAPADYVSWANAVPGVTRVYVERRWAGPGTVRIFPIFDLLFSGTGGIPDAGHVAQVAAAIAALAPAGALVTVAAAIAHPINLTVSTLLPSNAATQAAILAELAGTFQRLGRVAGGDLPYSSMPFLATPLTFPALWLSQAVANAAGVVSADVAASDTLIAAGELPTLGTVTFA